MVHRPQHFDTLIIGAGISGITTAYYLKQLRPDEQIALIDPLPPMSLTSARSGENYRNWWPHPTMVQLTNRSIDLMEEVARRSGEQINLTRRGYAIATRRDDIDDLIAQLETGGLDPNRDIRFHHSPDALSYPLGTPDWHSAPDGVDVIFNPELITRVFPSFDRNVRHVIHIRRAGDFSSQQLAQWMLDQLKAKGVALLQGEVTGIQQNSSFRLTAERDGQPFGISCEELVNAAGPFVDRIANMLELTLPVHHVLQQKLAFEDREQVIPRDMPFALDLDANQLDWDNEERELLAEDPEHAWLTQIMPGNTHCRPDGGDHGSWIKLGWAFNAEPGTPQWTPELTDAFPEIVLRGAARLNPALKTYYGKLPRNSNHYGGYYTMTEENWPLIGPMGVEGTYLVGALSGFGSMAACAAGELCARWMCDESLPDYAPGLSLQRYDNPALIRSLQQAAQKGVL